MPTFDTPSLYLLVGSQHLYRPEPLREVERNGQTVASTLSDAQALPCPVTFRGVVSTAEEVLRVCQEADVDAQCAGLAVWIPRLHHDIRGPARPRPTARFSPHSG